MFYEFQSSKTLRLTFRWRRLLTIVVDVIKVHFPDHRLGVVIPHRILIEELATTAARGRVLLSIGSCTLGRKCEAVAGTLAAVTDARLVGTAADGGADRA